MKNSEIVKLYDGLTELSKDKDIKFSVKTSFILAKNKALLEPFYKAAKECEIKIWNDFGEIRDNDLVIPSTRVAQANKAFDELHDIENDVPLEKISIDDFGEAQVNFKLIENILSIIKEA